MEEGVRNLDVKPVEGLSDLVARGTRSLKHSFLKSRIFEKSVVVEDPSGDLEIWRDHVEDPSNEGFSLISVETVPKEDPSGELEIWKDHRDKGCTWCSWYYTPPLKWEIA